LLGNLVVKSMGGFYFEGINNWGISFSWEELIVGMP